MDCIKALMAEGERSLSARKLSDIIVEVAETLTTNLGPSSESNGSATESSVREAPGGDSKEALIALIDVGNIDQGVGPLADLWRELDEIRLATQDAAAKFLACAETIEGVSERPDLDPDDQVVLSQVATDMYEATAFQDISGQRLTRIAETLRRIEYLVASAKAALGDDSAVADAEALSDMVEKTEHRKVEYILHGPEEAGKANTQEEIDKILASFD